MGVEPEDCNIPHLDKNYDNLNHFVYIVRPVHVLTSAASYIEMWTTQYVYIHEVELNFNTEFDVDDGMNHPGRSAMEIYITLEGTLIERLVYPGEHDIGEEMRLRIPVIYRMVVENGIMRLVGRSIRIKIASEDYVIHTDEEPLT